MTDIKFAIRQLMKHPGFSAVAKSLTGVLIGVTVTDLPSWLGPPLVLIAVTALACWLPALRASNTDPMEALRAE